MYPCHRPQHSHYIKHKSANPYVHFPTPTLVTLHKTQNSIHLCTLATDHNTHITQNTNQKILCTFATAQTSHIKQNTIQQILKYPCHRPQQSHYIKHKSAKPYVPLPTPTPFTLHNTQISRSSCTFANAHTCHITQNTNQQNLMYPCHRPQHSHYIKNKSSNPYVPLPPPKGVTLNKTQISKDLWTHATAHNSLIKKNTIQNTLTYLCHLPQQSHYT